MPSLSMPIDYAADDALRRDSVRNEVCIQQKRESEKKEEGRVDAESRV